MDLFVTELAGYGDLQMQGNDIAVAYGYESLPFLALFGGDSTWWGNALLPNQYEKFGSLTEKTMREVALNSAGRLKIESSIRSDLDFIKKNIPGMEITVNTFLVSDDRLDIQILINKEEWNYSWNPGGNLLPKDRIIYDNEVFTEQFTDPFK